MDEELHPTEVERQMGDLVRSHFPGGVMPEFKPYALYREDLDWIVVQIRDCSVTEVRGGGVLVLMEANYPQAGEAVLAGFVIECAHVYCKQQGLLHEGQVNLHEVLSSLLREPCCCAELNVNVARTALHHLEATHLGLNN